ncbi:ATP-binding protein [Roseinatronobacter alkalisoli]|uniref:histidine kinase n=1 Tax=Roseinatronobacter alkalisoli TaxID=3028235 RepID=A0ABT5T9A3_9RHOB|nr:ATP-binding protein [Roseinatronobacter sp. HJB301]MDD7971300.1 ATP-binding protein [Roseinatronobacter sp. HJB301]
MWSNTLKRILPRSFYGRAVLILIVPIIVIQIVLSVVFIQRHYERVTAQMTGNTLRDIHFLADRIDTSPQAAVALEELAALTDAMQIDVAVLASARPGTGGDTRNWTDLAGREILRVLRQSLPAYLGADLESVPNTVVLWLDSPHGVLQMNIPRRLVTTSNPHQLLVIVFLASGLMALIAFQFLRLQIRPIRRLGQAAEAYGRGKTMPFRAAGAREIRAASLAFIDMRNRIDRQNAQRKLMLSGVSHDMRTPLTRMRLILSMMDTSEDTAALATEIADLENLLNGFLDYSRGVTSDEPKIPTDPVILVTELVDRYIATGHAILLAGPVPQLRHVPLHKDLLERALDNLVSNALRHGANAQVSIALDGDDWLDITVDDDGPGIPPADRVRATEPFVRLDDARNRDQGGGVGLGLAIVAEAMRAHEGRLVLSDSTQLGGLRATLRLPLNTAPS